MDEKLHWAFKLYDKDGNGEIDPEEMEEIFTKLCSLVKVERKLEEKAKEREEEEKNKKKLATIAKLQKKDPNGGLKLISSKLANRNKRSETRNKPKQPLSQPPKVQKSKSVNHLKLPTKEDDLPLENESPSPTSDRSGRLSLDSGVSLECPSLSVAWEARNPDRDCSHFDPAERARELFEALDVNGDGAVTEDEFIQGCMKDDVFVMMLEKFSGDNIWGL